MNKMDKLYTYSVYLNCFYFYFYWIVALLFHEHKKPFSFFDTNGVDDSIWSKTYLQFTLLTSLQKDLTKQVIQT